MMALVSFLFMFAIGPLPILMILWQVAADRLNHRRDR
jgi:hypothetical protein